MWALRVRRAAWSVVMFSAEAMDRLAITKNEKKAIIEEKKQFFSMVLEEILIFRCLSDIKGQFS